MYFFKCTRIWPGDLIGTNLAGNLVTEDVETLSKFSGALT
jgi:hypothetical protein